MRVSKVLLLLAMALLVLAAAAEAREGYIVRFAGASIQPTGDLRMDESMVLPLGDGTTLEEDLRATVEAGSALGFCFEIERRFSDLFGLGFTVMRADHDVDLAGSSTVRIRDPNGAVLISMTESQNMRLGSVRMTPLLLGANFHFGGGEKVDLYAGPFVGLVDFSDLTFEGDTIGFKDEFAYGATLGLDVPLGERSIGFSAAARYMVAGAETDEVDSDTVGLDPLVVLFGVGYRF